MKKAAVYDRWLHELGGGEQVAFAYAEALRDLGYKTYLLTHKKVNVEAAEKKMSTNLDGIQIKYIPNLLDYQLSGYTEKYDVFVSNSYLDYIPNRSKYGILSIFFPSRISISFYEIFKRAYIVPSLRNFFIYPSRFEGFKYDEYKNRKMFKWLGARSTVNFNKSIKKVTIELYFHQLAISFLDNVRFAIQDKEIKAVDRKTAIMKNIVSYTFNFQRGIGKQSLTILLPNSEYNEVALVKIIIPGFRYSIYNIFKSLFPRLEMRLHGGPSVTKFSDVESYDSILSISKFSQKWIQNYWGLRSEVLYPPVHTTHFRPSKLKKNYVVHIGRFFVTGHSKKQLDLVRIFKKLVDQGYKDWEMHFVGSVAEGEAHHQYFNQVKEESVGYPIFFHINVPFTQLREILSAAKIYWHATGLDEDEESNPIRLEHFGITTIEAMASGCVPVVINSGGQAEIVTEGAGFRWNNREELLDYTKKLIQDPKLLKRYSLGAIERSKFFSFDNFKTELNKYLPSFKDEKKN